MHEVYTGNHLIYKKSSQIGTSTHANEIYDLKQNIFTNGRLNKNFEEKIPIEIRPIVLSCLYGEDIEIIKQHFIHVKTSMKYYFMERNELISRIMELEGQLK